MGSREIATSIMFFGAILSGILFFQASVFNSVGVQPENEQLKDLSKNLNDKTQKKTGTLQAQTRDIGNSLEAGLFYLRGIFDVLQTILDLALAIPQIAATIIISLKLPGWVYTLATIPFAYVLITLVFEAKGSS